MNVRLLFYYINRHFVADSLHLYFCSCPETHQSRARPFPMVAEVQICGVSVSTSRESLFLVVSAHCVISGRRGAIRRRECVFSDIPGR